MVDIFHDFGVAHFFVRAQAIGKGVRDGEACTNGTGW